MASDEKSALNAVLFRRCKATFGQVKIRNEGEKQTRRLSQDLKTGKPKPVIKYPGEYYAVCCPFCNDTRFRCYINHRYGTEDELGIPQTYLATCFNAGCPLAMKDRHTYDQLEDMLMGKFLHQLRRPTIREGREVNLDEIRATWPGKVTRLDKLPPTHEAVAYLAGRGFDPEMIGRFYNVHWCYQSTRFICEDRIVIPIYHNKRMVGWQVRPAYDTDWKSTGLPKYYTAPGTPRRRILYNFGNAVRYRFGVIFEGVTDVWKLGPQACCTLGATLTQQQQSLFARGFRNYAGGLGFDGDLNEELREKLTEIAADMHPRLKSGFCLLEFMKEYDPGSLDRGVLRPFIAQQAEQQGIRVSWKKR
jgi:hypothetical protein